MIRVLPFFLALWALLCIDGAFAPDPPSVTPSLAASSNAQGSATATSVNIPSSAPAGGITITQPVQTADPSYYKIAKGVDVTFGWNFTSVLQYLRLSPCKLTARIT